MTWQTQLTNDPYIKQLFEDNPVGLEKLLSIVERVYFHWTIEQYQKQVSRFYQSSNPSEGELLVPEGKDDAEDIIDFIQSEIRKAKEEATMNAINNVELWDKQYGNDKDFVGTFGDWIRKNELK